MTGTLAVPLDVQATDAPADFAALAGLRLGIGNAGHGMPDQTRFDLAHLLVAMPYGLDAILVNPATQGLVECARHGLCAGN